MIFGLLLQASLTAVNIWAWGAWHNAVNLAAAVFCGLMFAFTAVLMVKR